MAKQGDAELGHGRLLDAWVPPNNAGKPIGCFASTFTFASRFFEAECLSRFAGITELRDDSSRALEWALESHERLGALSAATVLVDQAHCTGLGRNLGWDLLSSRHKPNQGIMHAKVSLLHWTGLTRLIVASANLTEPGYRKNREAFVVVDWSDESRRDRKYWMEALAFIHQLLSTTESEGAPVRRAKALLEVVKQRVTRGPSSGSHKGQGVRFHGVGPREPSLFKHMNDRWAETRGSARTAHVVSPFFDPTDTAAKKTIENVWGLLATRGNVSLTVSAPAERDSEVVQLPEAWSKPTRHGQSVAINGVVPEVAEPAVKFKVGQWRPLHAKVLWLGNEQWSLFAVGSSNMTAAGTGIGKRKNWEAMASVLMRNGDRRALHCNAVISALGGDEIEDPEFKPSGYSEDSETDIEWKVLPECFGDATFRRGDSNGQITILLRGEVKDDWWFAFDRANGTVLPGRAEWTAAGAPPEWTWSWPLSMPPAGLTVRWTDGSKSWLPVCLESAEDLPQPVELRQLSLDQLISILRSARSPASVIAGVIARSADAKGADLVELDPHQRVDVSGFLLQRMVRISSAIQSLCARIAEPVQTREALKRRLNGPFGVGALLAAVDREHLSDHERRFIRAELCAELAVVRPRKESGHLPLREHRKEIKLCLNDVTEGIDHPESEPMTAIDNYVKRTTAHALETADAK